MMPALIRKNLKFIITFDSNNLFNKTKLNEWLSRMKNIFKVATDNETELVYMYHW